MSSAGQGKSAGGRVKPTTSKSHYDPYYFSSRPAWSSGPGFLIISKQYFAIYGNHTRIPLPYWPGQDDIAFNTSLWPEIYWCLFCGPLFVVGCCPRPVSDTLLLFLHLLGMGVRMIPIRWPPCRPVSGRDGKWPPCFACPYFYCCRGGNSAKRIGRNSFNKLCLVNRTSPHVHKLVSVQLRTRPNELWSWN